MHTEIINESESSTECDPLVPNAAAGSKIDKWYRRYGFAHLSVFILTYFSYACLHFARKCFSNVKNVLHSEWSSASFNNSLYPDYDPQPTHLWIDKDKQLYTSGKDIDSFLGNLDTIFMVGYAIGLYVSGQLGDRLDPKYVISIGLILSSVTMFVFGFLSEVLDFHYRVIYMIIWFINGLCQSTLWPANVATISKWFKNARGFIFGVWCSCTSTGNILVFTVTYFINYGYQYCFLFVSCVLFSYGFLILFGLISNPNDVYGNYDILVNTESSENPEVEVKEHINFFKALLIPGVIPYSLSYASLKLVNYSFMFWLPVYLKNNFGWDNVKSDQVSIWYDIGGFTGTIILGLLSDFITGRSLIVMACLNISIGLLFVYKSMGAALVLNIFVMALLGAFITTPCNLISATVSSELVENPKLQHNKEALSTVAGIIDGTGSFGVAIGQSIVPLMSHSALGWSLVFYFFVAMIVVTIVCIIHIFVKELRLILRCGGNFSQSA